MGPRIPNFEHSENNHKLVFGEKANFQVTTFGRSSCSNCNSVLNEDLATILSDELRGGSPESRFGLDIGGTLCKLVYFEPYPTYNDQLLQSNTFNEQNGFYSIQHSVEQKDHIVLSNSEIRIPNSELALIRNASSSERNGDFHNNNGGSLSRQFSVGSSASDWECASSDSSPSCINLTHEITFKESRCPSSSSSSSSSCSSCINHFSKNKARKLWMPSHDSIQLVGKGTIHFKCFETRQVEEFLQLSKELSLVSGNRAIGATGGGARKFGQRFLSIAGLHLHRADELTCLVRGIDFLIRNAIEDCFDFESSYTAGRMQRAFSFSDFSSDGDSSEAEKEGKTEKEEKEEEGEKERDLHSAKEGECRLSQSRKDVKMDEKGRKEELKRMKHNKRNDDSNLNLNSDSFSADDQHLGWKDDYNLYPYLVVNIGSGVSMLRVDSSDKFERVGGTSLGGSTFLGLTSALTGCESFQEAIDLASGGDSTQVDMLVGDIYGGDYTEMNLAATTVASSFGKLVDPLHRESARKFPANLAKAALIMVTNNIGSLAMLHATPAGVERILFAGSFLHHNKLAMKLLSGAIEFWSQGKMKAMFMRHEGHAGSIGALLSALNPKHQIDSLLLNTDDRSNLDTVDRSHLNSANWATVNRRRRLFDWKH